MRHISILIPNGQYSIVNIAGAHQILNWANDVYRQQTQQPLFQIEFVAQAKPAQDKQGYYTVSPSKTLAEIDHTDLIIIPAVHGDLQQSIQDNQPEINWVVQQYQKGAEIASFCIGVFLLAETGILNGKSCSTHWGHAEDLRQMFPDINVEAENIVTDANGIYTSGGAYAFTNLVIYLIEKYADRSLAIMTAKAFMIDIDKGSQSPFMMFSGQKDHKDALVLKVQAYLEKHFAQKISVEKLALENNLSRRTFERKFKQATGNSVLEYLQRVRTEAAKKQLESGQKSVNEVMYHIGYNDPKAFRTVFKKFVGISPVAYRKKYNKEGLMVSGG